MKDIRKCSRCGEKVDRKNMAFLSDDNFKTGHLVCWHCWEMLGGREEELKEKKKGSGRMTREEAIAFFKDMNECTYGNLEAVEMAIKALEQEPKWIPMTKRPMTDDEREFYDRFYIEGAMIFDCPLPEDGQEVLVSYGGSVYVDTFCIDEGCYFEYVDIDDVQAWMPLPKPYTESEK